MINDINTTLTGNLVSRNPVFLTPAELRTRCPAAFAKEPHARCSKSYRFVSTGDIIEHLAKEHGFGVTSVSNPVRKAKGKTGELLPSITGVHKVVFEPMTPITVVGEGRAQVALINSHDRTKRLTLAAGFFRLVCENGLIMGTNKVAVSATHLNSSMKDIDDQIKAIVRHAGNLHNYIGDMQATELTTRQRNRFAKQAAELRWGSRVRINPEILLGARRKEDEGDDLWRVFNRAQENLTRGGLHREGSTQPTMPIVRPRQDFRINSSLWDLAETFINA